ncbi:MAG: BolA family protein [Gammaproteobacteria bacterium]
MPESGRAHRLRERLESSLAPQSITIVDESHRHAGHTGARGGGHFAVDIVSTRFTGLTPIERHRVVYQAVGDLLGSEVHALSIRARAPGEG